MITSADRFTPSPGPYVRVDGVRVADDWQDLVDGELNAPINVSTQVRLAQFVALPLAVMIHADCTIALYYLRVKYEDDRATPTASKLSCYFSLAFRFLAGSMLVAASFMIIIQTTTIVGMFLNLGAIQFIGERKR